MTDSFHCSGCYSLSEIELISLYNTYIYLQEVGRSCGDWMELAQDRDRWRALVSTVMNLRVP